MIRHLLACALAIGVVSPGPALAQDGFGFAMILPTATQTDVLSMHLNDLRRNQERQLDTTRRSAAAGSAAGVPASAGAGPNYAALRYVPSKARRTANLARFVEKSRATDPAGAANLQATFAQQGDIIETIGQELRKQDLHIDNVADAYAAWWVTAWQATRGRSDDLDKSTLTAVRDQAARALGETEAFVRANEAGKQEFAESLLVQAALIEAAVTQAAGDPRRLRDVGVAVNRGAAGMGLDLTTMELTGQGFVAKAS